MLFLKYGETPIRGDPLNPQLRSGLGYLLGCLLGYSLGQCGIARFVARLRFHIIIFIS